MHVFTVWAPRATEMKLQLGDAEPLPMQAPDKKGWWRLKVEQANFGQDYAFLIDDDSTPYPDPRSMSQPKGRGVCRRAWLGL